MRPIVFVGPSIPIERARAALPSADFRAPVRRGDLDEVGLGSVVGIIDGVFAQTLAISPGEIREAIARGVTLYGAASMGALRAAEVPGVHGIGRIYAMYRDGAVERDDEVALLFDEGSARPLTVPLINVRYAVDRLVRSGTINREVGQRIVDAAARLHYTQRTYVEIFAAAKLDVSSDAEDLARLLNAYDLKREDAQFLLETLAQLKSPDSDEFSVAPPTWQPYADASVLIRVRQSEDSRADVRIWESGERIPFEELIKFLKLSGRFEDIARRTLARAALAGMPLRTVGLGSARNGDEQMRSAGSVVAAQDLLDAKRLEWGWESPEEAHVTLRDLGMGLGDLTSILGQEVAARRTVLAAAVSRSRVFAKALRAELWLDDLALKRETMRLGAFTWFAEQADVATLTDNELADSRRTLCRLHCSMQWTPVLASLLEVGLSEADIEQFVWRLARVRKSARQNAAELVGQRVGSPETVGQPEPSFAKWCALGLAMAPSPKPDGTRRFSRSLEDAHATAERIAHQIGIVRIGLIGELDELGIHVAQAFGERSGWSASFSSGKAETREGARTGSVMEEVEIHAQDAWRPHQEYHFAFRDTPDGAIAIEPTTLGLPFDTRYDGSLEIGWAPCVDLLGCVKVLVPTSALVGERIVNDVFYSPRLGGKIFSSSGLGSGFTLAEAAVHGAAELIERHALRLAELAIDNPAGPERNTYAFVDLATLPEIPRRLVEKYKRSGLEVRVLDITSDIAVPTFFARVFDDPFTSHASMTSDGSACHPDPEVAISMALLEAAQTKAGVIAGGREDYSMQARSLGRHERPRTMVPSAQTFWFANDRPMIPFSCMHGFVADDIRDEFVWILSRVAYGGYSKLLLADYTFDRIRPAYAVRVIIPGTETTNPFYTGPRARAMLIGDLLPRDTSTNGPLAK